ncbi:Mrp/NBP35 family ATP-binding protein [Tistrella bauzanensis]
MKAVIAVASGKGGVGKSTLAVNLALALQARGLKVGLLDADVYGPSIPRMLGLSGRPDSPDGKRITPKIGWGLKAMSIGLMVEEDTPLIWRGPMVQGALDQFLRETDWAPLDILVLDMPPGTGDVQLSIAQRVPLAGAVIVSTPQDIALLDARKGLAMFRRVEVPILGLVENMSWFTCPHCGGRSDIFGHGGARDEALKLGLPFLGAVPLDLDVRIMSDEGAPWSRLPPTARRLPLSRHRRRRGRQHRQGPSRAAAHHDRGLISRNHGRDQRPMNGLNPSPASTAQAVAPRCGHR